MSQSDSSMSEALPPKVSSSLIRALYLKKIDRIRQVVVDNPDFDVTLRINNQKKNTVLHMAAMLDNFTIMDFFVQIVTP